MLTNGQSSVVLGFVCTLIVHLDSQNRTDNPLCKKKGPSEVVTRSRSGSSDSSNPFFGRFHQFSCMDAHIMVDLSMLSWFFEYQIRIFAGQLMGVCDWNTTISSCFVNKSPCFCSHKSLLWFFHNHLKPDATHAAGIFMNIYLQNWAIFGVSM